MIEQGSGHAAPPRSPLRMLSVLFSLALCAGCMLTPHSVEPAPDNQSPAVVFDIDGTLTARVRAIRTSREGAVAAVQAYAAAGYRIIYLSARNPWFQWHIPFWMEQHGFPEGAIHVAQSRAQRGDHAAFKQAVLDEYRAKGWVLVAAYGDSSTDFDAYARAGIYADRVFALRREDARACEPGRWAACFSGWPEQMEVILDLIEAQGRTIPSEK